MKQIVILVSVILFALTGCGVKEEPVSTREPKNLITKEDYEDLKIEPKKEKPVEVDYEKGTFRQNFEPLEQ
jgi:hypothetical protein